MYVISLFDESFISSYSLAYIQVIASVLPVHLKVMRAFYTCTFITYVGAVIYCLCTCNSAGNTACMRVGISVNACEYCVLRWFYCFEDRLSEVTQLKKQLEEEKELLLAKVCQQKLVVHGREVTGVSSVLTFKIHVISHIYTERC